MANTLYPNFGSLMLGDAGAAHTLPDMSAPSGTGLQTHLVDLGTYTYSAAHADQADLTGIIATNGTATVGTPTVVNGVFDAANVTHTAVAGATIEAVVLSHTASGTTATNPLIVYYDTDAGGAIAITPNSGDIVIEWGASIIDLIT